MTITLNHTIVPAPDHCEAARFFASIMGLEQLPPAGRTGHFAGSGRRGAGPRGPGARRDAESDLERAVPSVGWIRG
jgi:hypothetical protein